MGVGVEVSHVIQSQAIANCIVIYPKQKNHLLPEPNRTHPRHLRTNAVPSWARLSYVVLALI